MENILSFRNRASKLDKKVVTEEALIKKSIKGDYEAFGELMKRYKEYLYKIAFVYAKSEDKSLEILQECTYKAFKNIKTLKEPKYFKTWVTRIMINVAIRTLEKDSKLVYLEDNNPLLKETSRINMEEKLDLYNAIDMLKEEYRVVIIMKYFNDMKVDDISSLLNIPESTVKTKLSRARKSLRNILKEGYLYD